MNADDKTAKETGTGDKNPLPIGESVPGPSEVKPVAPVEPVAPQRELAAQAAQTQPTEAVQPAKEPLLVRVVEDSEFSKFERKTILVGGLGIFVAFLALVAVSVTARFIFNQFGEMAKQTGILQKSFDKQKADSDATAITTGQQLGILQGQLTQQTNAMKLDERAWVSVVNPQPKVFEIGKTAVFVARLQNTGKTPALACRQILATMMSFPDKKQVFPIGPIIPCGTLPPGTSNTLEFYIPEIIHSGDIELLGRKSEQILIYAKVFYQDVFGKTHITESCNQLKMPRGQFAACEDYPEHDYAN